MNELATVVIPTVNKKELLSACLDSLQNQTTRDFFIIVVDNGSTDGTGEWIVEAYPKVKIIKNKKNKGFVAVNQAIKIIETKYVVLLNNDAVAERNWLENLVKEMEKTPEASFGASKVIQFQNKELLDSAGDGFNLSIMAGYPIGFGQKAINYNNKRFCFSATGGASIYRKSLFEEVGLFDQKFFAYFEDIDFGFRTNLAGFKCVYIPSAVVYHRGGATSVHNSRLHLTLTDRNKLITVLKNVPFKYYLKYKRATFDLFFWPFFEILKLHLSVWPFVNNRFIVLFWSPLILFDRLRIAKSRKITDQELEKILV